MAEYRQLEDGSFEIRRASGWEPVSAEQVQAAGQGRLARTGTAAFKGATALGHGFAELTAGLYANLPGLLGDKAAELQGRERAARIADQATLEGLGQADPAAAAARFLPELLLGVGGGRVGGAGIRGLAGSEAAIGATVGAASDPEHPVRGVVIGGALGGAGGATLGAAGNVAARAAGTRAGRALGAGAERLLDVLTMRPGERRGAHMGRSMVAEADRVDGAAVGEVETIATGRDRLIAQASPIRGVARSLPADPAAAAARAGGARGIGAAETPDAAAAAGRHQGGGRQLEGVADSRDMLDSGFPMSETHARILDTSDGLELQQLRSLDNLEDVQARTRKLPTRVLDSLGESLGGAPKVLDRGELAHEQQAWVNKYVAEEMGITGRSALDQASIERRMGELRGEFERINRETPGPIDMRGVGRAWEGILDKHMLAQGNPAYGIAERAYADLASRVKKDAAGNLTDGDVGKLAQMRNKLTAQIDMAATKPRTAEVAEVLRELRDKLDERFRKNWSPEMAEDHAQAQKQWWIAKAAQKTRAAVGARGDLNLPTFMGNYEGSGATRKTALLLAANRDFYRKMKAAQAVMHKETGDTGSGQTATEGILSGLVDMGVGMIPGAGLLLR